jgi:hypothetical protein
MDLPAWVTELTDPRRASSRDELADRLSTLAEQAIDVSRRLQAQLNELNAPFQQDELHAVVDRLKVRTHEALTEVYTEISASRSERLDRIMAMCGDRIGDLTTDGTADGTADSEPDVGAGAERGASELRRVLETEIEPALARQEASVVERVADDAASALREATGILLARVDELAVAVTDLIHQVLPMAREGLTLAGRVSELAGRAREGGRGPVEAELAAEADTLVGDFDASMGRLELEWAALGARSSTVRAALRGAEEAAFSQVAAAVSDCVGRLAAAHVKALADAEDRARELIDGLPER